MKKTNHPNNKSLNRQTVRISPARKGKKLVPEYVLVPAKKTR